MIPPISTLSCPTILKLSCRHLYSARAAEASTAKIPQATTVFTVLYAAEAAPPPTRLSITCKKKFDDTLIESLSTVQSSSDHHNTTSGSQPAGLETSPSTP